MLVGTGTCGATPGRRAGTEGGAYRDVIRLLGDVLMNGVIGKAGQGATATRDEQFDLVGGRAAAEFFEHRTGHVLGEHRGQLFPLYAVPTVMPRNLAGAAPCPVPITCCG